MSEPRLDSRIYSVLFRLGSFAVTIDFPETDYFELWGVAALLYRTDELGPAELAEIDPERLTFATCTSSDGRAFVARIAAEYPDFPIVIFTGEDVVRLFTV